MRKAVLFATLVGISAGPTRASTNYIDFNSVPSLGLAVTRAGDNGTLQAMAGVLISTNGSTLEPGIGDQSTNGYFAVTQTTPTNSFSAHGMRSALVFDEFDPGQAPGAFSLSCDVRIGGGSTTPADGLSFSFSRLGDSGVSATSEGGTSSGLAISLLAYGPDSATGNPGLQVKVDGSVVTNVNLTARNGACGDLTSVQTGPTDLTIGAADNLTNLCWQPFAISYDATGLLSVSYKGVVMIANLDVGYGPSAGKLVIAGRTGGLWQEQDVDNLSISTTPATKPGVGGMVTTLTTWSLKIYDSGTATPDTNTLTTTIDGAAVTPTSITQSGNLGSGDGTGVTTVKYRSLAQLFAPNSQHTNLVHFTGASFSGSVDRAIAFTVAAPTGAVAKVGGYSGTLRGAAKYSPNRGGRTGLPGDYAMDFVAAATGNCVLANQAAFAADLKAAAAADEMTISLWEKRRVLPGGAPSIFWIFAPGEAQGRGWQLHCPYADERVFFDTGGLASPAQRISANVNSVTLPAFADDSYWTNNGTGNWRHIVAIKNHGAKQVWIDGYLFINQTSGADPLRNDFNQLTIGSAINGSGPLNSINGLIDDFAIYSSALSGTDVTNLFNGTPPDSIGAASSLLAWWDFNDAPPTLSLTKAGTDALITYSQTLQAATNVAGPYADVPGATSPYTNSMSTNAMMFFRARK